MGSQPNTQDCDGATPLCQAIERGDVEGVELLLVYKAEVNFIYTSVSQFKVLIRSRVALELISWMCLLLQRVSELEITADINGRLGADLVDHIYNLNINFGYNLSCGCAI